MESAMAYDTGSNMLTIFEEELDLFYGLPNPVLPKLFVETAAGVVETPTMPVEVRLVVMSVGVLQDWYSCTVVVIPRSPGSIRLSPVMPPWYLCLDPDNELWVAKSKTKLGRIVPSMHV
jgi:hypothetical protein